MKKCAKKNEYRGVAGFGAATRCVAGICLAPCTMYKGKMWLLPAHILNLSMEVSKKHEGYMLHDSSK
jgi:hypothetical protein